MRNKIRALLPLFAAIGGFLLVGAVLITSGVLPEERAKEFRPLTEVSIPSEMKVIQEPTLEDNTFIYAVNDVAARGIEIVQRDPEVKQILKESADRKAAVTIAAVQPTVIQDRQSGELHHSSAGQVIITANWQDVNGASYSEPKNSAEIANHKIQSFQQIWHVLLDIDIGQVTQITQQADRIIQAIAKTNLVRLDVNMFVPNAMIVDAGSTIKWLNTSTLPHNVVGILNLTATLDIEKGPGFVPNNTTNDDTGIVASEDSASVIALDSGFVKPGTSWQYRFEKAGVFNYRCTIHSEEGMRGTMIVVASS